MKLSTVAAYASSFAIAGVASAAVAFVALYVLVGAYLFPSEPIKGTFWLYSNSRLPAWMKTAIPERNVAMRITLSRSDHLLFEARRRTASEPTGGELLQRESGTYRWHPVTVARAQQRGCWEYPLYLIVTIGGAEEVLKKDERAYFWLADPAPPGAPRAPREN